GELVAKDDVIERGASPERGNYLNFVFVYDQGELSGINFLFPNFQVGSYAEGSYEVFVPKNVFNAFLVKENKGAKH
nr:hypothetical protein [Candidatus Dadabacteria bacterium]NIQ16435.1 hypothetical protein [Candidatus Dadabacteria bacterium]